MTDAERISAVREAAAEMRRQQEETLAYAQSLPPGENNHLQVVLAVKMVTLRECIQALEAALKP